MNEEFDFIRDIGVKNGYPRDFIDGQIRKILNRTLKRETRCTIIGSRHEDITNKKKTDFYMLNLPYIGPSTKFYIRRFQCFVKKTKPDVQLMILPAPPPAVRQRFKNKDDIPKNLQSGVVYHITCNDCTSHYIRQTSRQVIRRLIEHGYKESGGETMNTTVSPVDSSETMELRSSERIKKKLIGPEINLDYSPVVSIEPDNEENDRMNTYEQLNIKSAIGRHEVELKHRINYSDWNILSKDNSNRRLKIKETLAIMSFKPDLNAILRSTPLIIFPEGRLRKERVKFKQKNSTH